MSHDEKLTAKLLTELVLDVGAMGLTLIAKGLADPASFRHTTEILGKLGAQISELMGRDRAATGARSIAPINRGFFVGGRGGEYLVHLRWEPNAGTGKIYCVDFEIVQVIIGAGGDGEREYGNDVQEMKKAPAEAEPALSGDVKWDGCTNIWFPRDVAHHACGADQLKLLFDAMAEARRVAMVDVMGQELS